MNERSGNIQITGTISSVVYSNEENGYTVLRLSTGDGGLVTVTGILPSAMPGETLRAEGSWGKHPTHGAQFKAELAERLLPRTGEAIYEYLAGGALKGVGPATAALIVDRFGEKTLDVIENHPDLLSEIKNISSKKAEQMSAAFRRQAGLRRLMEFLCAHQLRPILAVKLYRFYGEASLEVLQENPYILALPHIGGSFAEADILALELGMEDDADARVSAAAVFELQHNANNGHCFIPADKLIAATAQLISVSQEAVTEALTVLCDEGTVVREQIAGCDAVYLSALREAEAYTAARLRLLSDNPCQAPGNLDALIGQIEQSTGMTYAPLQRDTIALAARRSVLVMTGGPGTGKTTTVRAILSLYDALGIETLLTAPTGRAAKRMSELTGREASTIHRLLGAAFTPDQQDVVFQHDESDPLHCGAVVLDECSMVDITLMRALLCALPTDCRLVLVGDADQLPSVGPGNVFADIIRSSALPVVRLTEIFRQSEGSRIVRYAHQINEGTHPPLGENSGDFFFLRRQTPQRTTDTVVELCAERLPKKMGIPAPDIQVLTPTRKGDCGTFALNKLLQAALNPAEKGKNEKIFGEVTFREGDRVMQIRNNYDTIWKKPNGEAGAGVYNGDVGYLVKIDPGEEKLWVDFGGPVAEYSFEALPELEHAWAMTVHKSQGSEYPAVVLCLQGGAQQLMYRGILYTAVTRARDLLVAVGDNAQADRMIDNHRQSRRYSGLRARLCE
jgi:exodeoxyribonuclease V alpha subunit